MGREVAVTAVVGQDDQRRARRTGDAAVGVAKVDVQPPAGEVVLIAGPKRDRRTRGNSWIRRRVARVSPYFVSVPNGLNMRSSLVSGIWVAVPKCPNYLIRCRRPSAHVISTQF